MMQKIVQVNRLNLFLGNMLYLFLITFTSSYSKTTAIITFPLLNKNKKAKVTNTLYVFRNTNIQSKARTFIMKQCQNYTYRHWKFIQFRKTLFCLRRPIQGRFVITQWDSLLGNNMNSKILCLSNYILRSAGKY